MSISIQWPSTLPDMPQRGFTESVKINVLRTSADLGNPNTRRRSSRPSTLSVTYTLTSAQVVVLESFVKNTLKGVHWFVYKHPRMLNDVGARINVGNGGKYYDVMYAAPGYWTVRLDLEIVEDALNDGLAQAPTNVVATLMGSDIQVTFDTVDYGNNYPATSYTVLASPGDYTVTGNSSPLLLTGLPMGTTYTIRVRANNAVGNGYYSESSYNVELPPDPTVPLYTLTSTETKVSYNQFGTAAVITDDYVIVGCPFSSIYSNVQVFNKLTGTLFRTIINPANPLNIGYTFGEGIAAENDYLAVADPSFQNNGGIVYVYSIASGSLLYTITNPLAPNSANDEFGMIMEINNGILAISSNATTVYTYSIATGNPLLSITPPIAGRISMSMYSSYIALSSQNSIDGNYYSGKACLYNVVSGELIHVINNPNAYGTNTNDLFGCSVAMYGNKIVIGARGEDEAAGTWSGKAYIFDSNTGSLIQTLNNPNSFGTVDGEEFGSLVAIDGTHVFVSAPYESDANGNYSGKVYVYNISDWSLAYTINNPNTYGTSTDDSMGITGYSNSGSYKGLNIRNGYLVVGVPFEDSAAGTDTGAVYVFKF